MPGERRTSGEGLLAVCIWALVGALAGVDPAVTGKRAAVAERLDSC
jgi:hypothetical protein